MQALEHIFPAIVEAGTSHKNKMTPAPLVFKKRRNHKIARFCSISIFWI